MKFLIVGAGCTGAATAVKLRERFGPDTDIHVWEKARGAGGRFTTSRDTYPDGLRADLGAQYASVDPKDAGSMALMEAIVQEGGAELSTQGWVDVAERAKNTLQYRGVTGQNGIVKTMLGMAKAEVSYERRVSRIDLKGSAWAVTAFGGHVDQFQAVFLCVPGCGPGGDNLNKIHGNWEKQLTASNWKDTEVPHDCRYSLALWIEAGHHNKLAAFFGDMAEKLHGGDVIDLAIWQSRKDGEVADGPQVVVVHTPQGARGNKQQAESRMRGEILNSLKIPSKAVSSSKIITWFQSQVISTTSHMQCLAACQAPPLILAGDYFTSSSFSGCAQSAAAAASEAAQLLLSACRANAAKAPAEKSQDAAPKRVWGPTSHDGQGPVTCAECGSKKDVFLDKSDGKRYCDSCWKSYYGRSPPGASGGYPKS